MSFYFIHFILFDLFLRAPAATPPGCCGAPSGPAPPPACQAASLSQQPEAAWPSREGDAGSCSPRGTPLRGPRVRSRRYFVHCAPPSPHPALRGSPRRIPARVPLRGGGLPWGCPTQRLNRITASSPRPALPPYGTASLSLPPFFSLHQHSVSRRSVKKSLSKH